MTGARIALPLGLVVFCLLAGLVVVPRGIDAAALLQAQDDPALLADRGLDRGFDAAVATREIEAALAAGDIDLATSFLDLARDRKIELDPALVARVEAANSTRATLVRTAGSFGRGLITGEPEDLVGLAGTAVGDAFVFGDIRDAVREGTRLANGEQADELILGLAAVGLAITAGTYATLGAGAPARAGLTVAKVARRTGRITMQMSEWFGRSLREVVDWAQLKRALGWGSLTEPAVTVRAVRQAVKVEKAQDLVQLAGDIGRVQGKAGTQAAVDGLKLAQGPRDVSRLARLAEVKGTRTRAILKTLGRGALFLTTSVMSLLSWIFAAVMAVFGFCAAAKRSAERATERYIAYRKQRRARQELRLGAMVQHA